MMLFPLWIWITELFMLYFSMLYELNCLWSFFLWSQNWMIFSIGLSNWTALLVSSVVTWLKLSQLLLFGQLNYLFSFPQWFENCTICVLFLNGQFEMVFLHWIFQYFPLYLKRRTVFAHVRANSRTWLTLLFLRHVKSLKAELFRPWSRTVW